MKKIIINIKNNKLVDYTNLDQCNLYIKTKFLFYKNEKQVYKQALNIYYNNLGINKRFNLKKAKELFELILI